MILILEIMYSRHGLYCAVLSWLCCVTFFNVHMSCLEFSPLPHSPTLPNLTSLSISLSLVPPPQRFHAFFHNFTHYSLSVMIYAIVALLTYYILWLDGDLNTTFKTFASKPRNLQPYFTTYTSRYHSSTFYNC